MEKTKMKRSTKKGSKEKGPSEKGPAVKDTNKKRSTAKPAKKELKSGSVFPASSNDQPTDEDFLGFEPYVRAIAEFLTNESTKPPLVLSIEGEWGIGGIVTYVVFLLFFFKKLKEFFGDPRKSI